MMTSNKGLNVALTPHGLRLRLPQPLPVTRQTMFADLPQFLTVEEFRTVVGLGRSTVYDLLRRGAIPHRRFGRVVRIPKSALRPYCDLADDGMESRDDQTEQSP